MPLLRSEDAGRSIPNIWHGPTGAWRWPFDAEYVHWAMGLVAFALLGTALFWVVPLAAWALLLDVGLTRWLLGRLDNDAVARWTRTTPQNARRRGFRILLGLLMLFEAAIVTRPVVWLLPQPLWLSIISALAGAVVFVRRYRRWVDGNRPLAYWIATFRALAHGPRARRPASAVAFGAEPQINSVPLDDDLADFLATVNATDPKEVRVIIAHPRTAPVEAMLWDSRTGQPETCEHVLAWLADREIDHTVLGTDYREGLGGRKRVRVRVMARGQHLIDGRVVTLVPDANAPLPYPVTIRILAPAEFARLYEEVTA